MSFKIRDALAKDAPACLALDATYETERVWQMTVQPESAGRGVYFRTDRLPRSMDVVYPVSEHRLKLALNAGQCFLVAEAQIEPGEDTLLGYLTMRIDPVHRTGWVQDVVVDRPYRRQGIGARLFKIAQRWAREQDMVQITVETQTKNYPAIGFCEKQNLTFCGYNDRYFHTGDIAVFFGKTLR
jgi:GNAT superfamily N-acetyltransferase